jgi:hypothetical protein
MKSGRYKAIAERDQKLEKKKRRMQPVPQDFYQGSGRVALINAFGKARTLALCHYSYWYA